MDPEALPAKPITTPDGPLYFLACNMGDARIVARHHDCLLVAAPNIRSKKHIQDLTRWIEQGKKIIVDSGVFELCAHHAKAHGMSLTQALSLPPERVDGFARLMDHYTDIAKKLPPVFALVEVDIGGKKHKRQTRAWLEKLGLKVCPVVHPRIDGWEYLDEVAVDYPTVFIGNVVDASASLRLDVQQYLARWRLSHPQTWLHLLGVTPSPAVLGLPVDSCDSSTWLASVKFTDTWQASALWNKLAGFDRTMIYSRKHKQEHMTAKAVVAIDEDCQALSALQYYRGIAHHSTPSQET